MDFLKMKRFRKLRRSKSLGDVDPENSESPPEEAKKENADTSAKAVEPDPNAEAEDDEDDDFITNEVRRRLKELRKNSFMVLIPEEETCPEEEEEEETSSSDWRESEVEDGYPWCGFESFDTFYDKYCERMLFFDKMIAQQLQEAASQNILHQSSKSTSKKLATTLKSLSFKRWGELQDDRENIQQSQEDNPYQNLETAYAAHVSLSWEVLHCQYVQLSQRIFSQPESSTSYCYAAQAFQQFQVLLQRFIENEPFEQGSRVEIYARFRVSMPKLLQVPNYQDWDHKKLKDDGFDTPILACDLLNILENSILTFRQFLKMEKKKLGSSLNLFASHDQAASSLQQVRSSLDKKEIRVKELAKKKKGWKKKSWSTAVELELLFALIDIKVISRVLRMQRISKEQLLWCEEKMSKLNLTDNKLQRNGAPMLFPC